MAGNRVALTVEILADASGAEKGIDQATKKVSGFESGISKLTPAAAIVGGGLALIGKEAVDSASRVEQSMGALDAVFGENSDVVKEWAANASDAVGLSKAEYSELASVVGAQLNNMGLDTQGAMDGTQDLISVGADLAATFGGSTADAVSALSSALKGEADPAEKYGLSLNKTAVNAKLAEEGLDKLTGSERKAAEAQAILEMATDQAGGALGSFARESDTLEGQQQRTAAATEDAKAAIGESLLPAVTLVTAALGEMAGFVSDNTQLFLVIGGVLAATAGTVLVLNAAMKVYHATTKAITAATKAWAVATKIAKAAMTALSANPIMLIVTAVVLLVAGIVLLWNKCEGFRNAVMAVWSAIQKGAEVAWAVIKAVIGGVIKAITAYIRVYLSVVKAVFNAIKAVATAVWNAIKVVINAVIKGITAYIRTYLAVVRAVFNAIKAVAVAVWNAIKGVIKGVINALTSYIRSFLAVVKGVWSAIRAAAATAWNAVAGIVKGVIERIKGYVRAVKDVVTGVWASIKSATSSAWDSISGVIESALRPIKGIIDGIKSAFDSVVRAVERVIAAIGRIKIPKIKLPDLNPFNASAPPPAPSVSSRALGARAGVATSGTGTSGSGAPTVVIQGALDPVAVARQVRAILRDDDRRRRGVLIGGRTA